MLNATTLFASLTRISDLSQSPFQITALDRSHWDSGDYVVGEVTETSRSSLIELTTGRMTEVTVGDLVVGAFGVRAATLEAVGHFNAIGDDGGMQAMTAAGIFGRVTSQSTFIPQPVRLQYRGHVTRHDQKVRMADFVPPSQSVDLSFPVVLLIGTSMSSGKTTSARVIVRRLKRMGLRVVGAKLTGAGRYRDILAMSDSGADAVFDFVDQGLPSTVCDPDEFRQLTTSLLSRIAAAKPDVLVAEAGASPLEPYNGDVAIEQLGSLVRCTVLCASDPYAVVGVIKGFGFHPDLVAGVAASTSAGVEVITKLAGTRALNLLNPESHPQLDQLLAEKLALP
jgi:hypothetical protein